MDFKQQKERFHSCHGTLHSWLLNITKSNFKIHSPFKMQFAFLYMQFHLSDMFTFCLFFSYKFIYVPSPHTKVLSDVLLDCLLEWNIDRKLSTLTIDNCSINDTMIKILLKKLQNNSLILHGSLIHMCYTVHILNLIIQDGLRIIEECIEKICDSVVFWTGSMKKDRNL